MAFLLKPTSFQLFRRNLDAMTTENQAMINAFEKFRRELFALHIEQEVQLMDGYEGFYRPLRLEYELYQDMFPEDKTDYHYFFRRYPKQLCFESNHFGVLIRRPNYEAVLTKLIRREDRRQTIKEIVVLVTLCFRRIMGKPV